MNHFELWDKVAWNSQCRLPQHFRSVVALWVGRLDWFLSHEDHWPLMVMSLAVHHSLLWDARWIWSTERPIHVNSRYIWLKAVHMCTTILYLKEWNGNWLYERCVESNWHISIAAFVCARVVIHSLKSNLSFICITYCVTCETVECCYVASWCTPCTWAAWRLPQPADEYHRKTTAQCHWACYPHIQKPPFSGVTRYSSPSFCSATHCMLWPVFWPHCLHLSVILIDCGKMAAHISRLFHTYYSSFLILAIFWPDTFLSGSIKYS